MSSPAPAPEASAPTSAAPDSLDDIRAGLAARLDRSTTGTSSPSGTTSPTRPSPDAEEAESEEQAQDAPEEPAEEPSAQDSGTSDADPLAGLSRRQRGELLKAAQTQLQQEQAARATAEQRAAELEQQQQAAQTLYTELIGTPQQLADLKRRARDGDAYARQQVDIYEANQEALLPIQQVMRRDATAHAWTLIGEDFKAMAAHLPAEKRSEFLAASNIKAGGAVFAAALTEHVTAPLKDEIKALKAEIKGLKATNGSRGAAPAAGGRSALGASDPNASSLDLIRSGLQQRFSRSG